MSVSSDFIASWIADNIDRATSLASIPQLVTQCEQDARAQGIEIFNVVDETGMDIRAHVKQALNDR